MQLSYRWVVFLEHGTIPAVKFMALLSGIYSLVWRYGFYLSENEILATENRLLLSVGILLGMTFLRGVFSKNKIEFVKTNQFDCVFFGLVGVYILLFAIAQTGFFDWFWHRAEFFIRGYFVVVQILLLLSFLHVFFSLNSKILGKRINPYMFLALSFLSLILLGTMLLMLPKVTVDGMGLPFVKALFMATSAICVTGLTVLNISTDLTFLGQLLLLILIQLGGIGIMTLTTLILFLLAGGAGLRGRANVKELLGEENFSTLYSTLLRITLFTLGIECIGFLFLYRELPSFATESEKIFYTIFHVVSAFCNAGFAISGKNLADPLFANNVAGIITVMILIVAGGLGFPVLSEFYEKLTSKKKRRQPFSIHTKLVVLLSGLLILIGAVTFFIFESPFSMKHMSTGEKIVHSLFLSVSPRTAGFNTIEIARLSQATIIFTMILMWIGASPNSAGGGIKTTTLAICFLNIHRILTGQKKIRLFKSSLSNRQADKAFALLALSGIYIVSITLLIQVIEINNDVSSLDILFETISALGTVGLTLGITNQLSDPALIVLTVAMFIGRIGFLTLPAALIIIKNRPSFEYIEKSVIL